LEVNVSKNAKTKMIQVPLSRAEFTEYVRTLADTIQNDSHVNPDVTPAQVPRLWRRYRRWYIPHYMGWMKGMGRECARKYGFTKAELVRTRADNDRIARLIDRLCPLLASSTKGAA
jgi:hypothetical protein